MWRHCSDIAVEKTIDIRYSFHIYLPHSSQFIGLDQKVRRFTPNMRIPRIKIYTSSGVTNYSADPEQLGAALDNSPVGDAVQDNFRHSFTQNIINASAVESHRDFTNATGKIVGLKEVNTTPTVELKRLSASISARSIVLAMYLCLATFVPMILTSDPVLARPDAND